MRNFSKGNRGLSETRWTCFVLTAMDARNSIFRSAFEEVPPHTAKFGKVLCKRRYRKSLIY